MDLEECDNLLIEIPDFCPAHEDTLLISADTIFAETSSDNPFSITVDKYTTTVCSSI